MILPQEADTRGTGHSAAVAAGVIALAIGTLAFAGWQIALRLPQPFEIDYGEGFVWSQVADLLAGRLYRPLSEYPVALMHYTPLFHAATALLWKLGLDPLLAGRLVSLIAGAALTGACGALAYRGVATEKPTRLRWLAALAAMALVIGTPEVIEWSTLMRVDMLATSLGMLGLAALAWSERHRWAVPAAGLCFLLSIAAKQSAGAPALAGIAALLWARPRAGLALGGTLALIGGAAVVLAELASGGEFLRHTVLYDAARVRWDKFLVQFVLLLPKSVNVIGIAVLVAIARLRDLASGALPKREPHAWVSLALALNLGLGLIAALGLAKMGAGSAYLLPLLTPAAVLAGIALAQWPRYSPLLLVILAGQIAFGLATYPLASRTALLARARAAAQVLAMIRNTEGPVLSEDMSLLMRAGRPVPWEMGSITELTLLGFFDETSLVQRLRDRRFKLVIVETWAPQFYSPGMRAAIEGNYRQAAPVPPFEIWRPMGGPTE